MTSLDTINELFPARATQSARQTGVEGMGSKEFLTLMVAQLQNQDPTKPLDNMDFMGQLAQFGTVSGIQELNAGFSGLATALGGSQALQATSLIGRSVVTESNTAWLREVDAGADGGSRFALAATVAAPAGTGAAMVYVQDMGGRLVYAAAMDVAAEGGVFRWDGMDAGGELVPPGRYRISAEVLGAGEARMVPVHGHQPVQSVSVDARSGAIALNLASGESVRMADVMSIL